MRTYLFVGTAIFILAGCGGKNNTQQTEFGHYSGIYRGTLQTRQNQTITIELEQVHRNNTITGNVRIIHPDELMHGKIQGNVTTTGIEADMDMGERHGVFKIRATGRRDELRVTFDHGARFLGQGEGVLKRVANNAEDLSGTYELDWVAGNQNGSFNIEIIYANGQNQLVATSDLFPFSGVGIEGAITGDTLSLRTFVFAGMLVGTAEVNYGPAKITDTGNWTGKISEGQGHVNTSGTYTLTKITQ
jgi:hypothetical protein